MAKLSTGQKRKQKQVKRQKKKGIQRFAAPSVVAPSLLHTGLPKMSDTLFEYAAPLVDYDAVSKEEATNVLNFAVICWNLSFLEEKTKERFEEVVSNFIRADAPQEVKDSFAEDVMNMVIRRRELYGYDPRRIEGFSLMINGDGKFHLQVASFLPADAIEA